MHFTLSEHGSPNSIELDYSILRQECFTAAAHFLFQCESFKDQFDGIVYLFFFNFLMTTVKASGDEQSLKISMPCHR